VGRGARAGQEARFRSTFERMALATGGQPAAGTWPAELSGEISWSCGPWSSVRATQGP